MKVGTRLVGNGVGRVLQCPWTGFLNKRARAARTEKALSSDELILLGLGLVCSGEHECLWTRLLATPVMKDGEPCLRSSAFCPSLCLSSPPLLLGLPSPTPRCTSVWLLSQASET